MCVKNEAAETPIFNIHEKTNFLLFQIFFNCADIVFKMYFLLKFLFESKLKKPVTQCLMPKSKIISLFMKKSKKPTKIKNCPLEKISK